ncbi:MAG TPA: FKBP-type peptidyl-prolyl cis-trans isomerase [Streptosporangiaceae bacterium]|nr:FKBP-type peptidyl-prolyl cis-trans isomerase [Streptosporangiaceae bacterium]
MAAALTMAGCGSSGSSGSSASNPNSDVKVTGSFGKAPEVTIPAEKAGSKLDITTPIQGSGPALKTGDDVLANLAIYVWSGTKHKLLDSTFKTIPQILPSQIGLKGLAAAVKGQKIGSRVVAVVPPADGYGKQGNSQIGVSGTDTTVWVIDLIRPFSPTQAASGKTVSSGGGSLPSVKNSAAGPVVTIPKKGTPPGKLVSKTLIQGTGPKLQPGETVVAQYVAVNWRTKQVFNSTWPSSQSAGTPFSFTLGSGGAIPGFIKGLTGANVGSRMMVVIPPAEGYGKSGQPQAGIKGTDTLVFVVDILAGLPAASA